MQVLGLERDDVIISLFADIVTFVSQGATLLLTCFVFVARTLSYLLAVKAAYYRSHYWAPSNYKGCPGLGSFFS